MNAQTRNPNAEVTRATFSFACWLIVGVVLLIASISESANAQSLYHETLRPQFHFTADKGWLNDPNGMVFYKGEYHLFFQRTENDINGKLKTWGHAVSTDMMHWKQIADAITPDEKGDIWSGSAVVDWNNTAGFQTGDEKPLVAMWTCNGPFYQCLSYSNDKGRTWTKYSGNPVLPHINGGNRDPKLIWFEPTRQWIVALYLDRKNDYGLFTSPDLKHWTQTQTIALPGSTECPDFFPLNLDGEATGQKWILTGASGRYMVGSFDGKTFTPETPSQTVEYGGNCYAAQTFSDIPPADGRRIQIGWMAGGRYPGMPFNQQMSIPCELSLRTVDGTPRMFKYPVKEVDLLHDTFHEHEMVNPASLIEINNLSGNLLDITADITIGDAAKITLSVAGTTVDYDCTHHLLINGKHGVLEPENGNIKLRVLVDRTSIEVFGNDGRVAITRCFLADPNSHTITLKSDGGNMKRGKIGVYEMKPVWQ
jgi:sucrose-6-phosphate hydrolase SacC (GH32 family)